MKKLFTLLVLAFGLAGCVPYEIPPIDISKVPRWYKITLYSDGKVIKEYVGVNAMYFSSGWHFCTPQAGEKNPEIVFVDMHGDWHRIIGTITIDPIK